MLSHGIAFDGCVVYWTYSGSSEGVMCRPHIMLPVGEKPYLKVVSGRHPCISQTYSGEEFIPNDVVMEGERLCTVITGPNMGGKSTLMRQTGLLVILAQLVSCPTHFLLFLSLSSLLRVAMFRPLPVS